MGDTFLGFLLPCKIQAASTDLLRPITLTLLKADKAEARRHSTNR